METNAYRIRPETPKDYRETENLTREAFWNVYRPSCSEHYVLHCYRGRADFVPALNFVMEKGGRLIGHIMYAQAAITAESGAEIPIMTFGPLSIAPEYQRQGYGTALLSYSMEKAKAMGAGALCIEGNLAFYGKQGFVLAGNKGIRYYAEPQALNLPYFLIKELTEGFLTDISGVYRTPAGYFVDEKETEEFDALFSPKVKLKQPGQLL